MRLVPILALLVLLVAPAAAEPQQSLAGSLLVASPELGDPNFEQTVVLMLQDDEQGALGVVINRPYGKAPTGELLRRLGVDPGDAKGETELFYGGPVEPEIGGVALVGGGGRDLLDADDDLHRLMPACAISRRAITSRWICWVPSYSWVIFASRIIRSTGYSLLYP